MTQSEFCRQVARAAPRVERVSGRFEGKRWREGRVGGGFTDVFARGGHGGGPR